ALQVAVDDFNPLTFQYNFTTQQYEIRGGLTLTIPTKPTESTVDVNLGYANNPTDPGIVFRSGELTQFNATVNTTFFLAGAEITTNNGLNFSYDANADQFEMGGSLTVNVPSGLTKTSLTAQLEDPNGNPGLVIQHGALQYIDMTLSGQFH